jgi:hypothetical protein
MIDMGETVIHLTGRERLLLVDALDDTLRNLEYYINDGNDEESINANKAMFNEYSHILSKLEYAKPIVNKRHFLKTPDIIIDNPDFLEIL